jgi:hypothetical protein
MAPVLLMGALLNYLKKQGLVNEDTVDEEQAGRGAGSPSKSRRHGSVRTRREPAPAALAGASIEMSNTITSALHPRHSRPMAALSASHRKHPWTDWEERIRRLLQQRQRGQFRLPLRRRSIRFLEASVELHSPEKYVGRGVGSEDIRGGGATTATAEHRDFRRGTAALPRPVTPNCRSPVLQINAAPGTADDPNERQRVQTDVLRGAMEGR